MAGQQDWYLYDQADIAPNLVTVSDIAVRAGSEPSAAQTWTEICGFSRPIVPACVGGPVWWWPAVREFIISYAGDLPGYQPPPGPPPRPEGRPGPAPYCL
jgi:hypothetical protein